MSSSQSAICLSLSAVGGAVLGFMVWRRCVSPPPVKILVCGLACVDVANTVEEYPSEDSCVRASCKRVARGGNASNTSAVLGHLGEPVGWMGTLGGDSMAELAERDLREAGVQLVGVRRFPDQQQPTAQITVSAANKSRTVVLFNCLPELELADFDAVDLAGLEWMHVEARRGRRDVLSQALKAVLARRTSGLKVSIELEKPIKEDLELAALADVVLCSREFAECHGYEEPQSFLRFMAAHCAPDAVMVCAWGKQGAHAAQRDLLVSSGAFPPAQEMDTIGAGDTFNAGMIRGLHRGLGIQEALTGACKLAGCKVGMVGFSGLQEFPRELP